MKTIIQNATVVNENKSFVGNIIIQDDIIEDIVENLPEGILKGNVVINASGKIAIPGIIDDQVHFREPGLEYKGEISTESASAIAGGTTSLMEMPNTNPQTVTQDALKKKFELGAEKALTNFSFYIGATNDNIKELIKTDPKNVCGIKVFMGASTGNMLVDDEKTLQAIFAEAPTLVATHCEDEKTIQKNLLTYINKYGNNILPEHHPLIRSEEACYKSSAKAVELATKYNTQLHVLHLSTARELGHFTEGNIEDKRITAEVCVHHLCFNSDDYKTLGHKIKWNPAIKTKADQIALLDGVLKNRLDVIATDHAPHIIEEKLNQYTKAASGGPLVQHSLQAMLEFYHQGKITLENIVHKMCHAPSILYKIDRRGYLRKGYYADIALIDLNESQIVTKESLLYKCGWSPFEGTTFKSKVTHTFVNGNLVYGNGKINKSKKGIPLVFNR